MPASLALSSDPHNPTHAPLFLSLSRAYRSLRRALCISFTQHDTKIEDVVHTCLIEITLIVAKRYSSTVGR
jgi:hypothetical protein